MIMTTTPRWMKITTAATIKISKPVSTRMTVITAVQVWAFASNVSTSKYKLKNVTKTNTNINAWWIF